MMIEGDKLNVKSRVSSSTVRVDGDVGERIESIAHQVGLKPTDMYRLGVNMLIAYVDEHGHLPILKVSSREGVE